MKRLLACLMCACFFLQGHSQLTKSDYYNRIDNKIYLFSKKGAGSFDSVTAFVNHNFTGSEDKVRAYYTWIALNISYDTKRLSDMDLLKHTSLRNMSELSQMRIPCSGKGSPCAKDSRS